TQRTSWPTPCTWRPEPRRTASRWKTSTAGGTSTSSSSSEPAPDFPGKIWNDREFPRVSSSVTFARAPRRVPGAGERAFRVRGQITLGSRLLKGRIEGNDGEDPTSCSGLRQRLLLDRDRESLRWPVSSRPD